jgi:hypothetical protein
MGRLLLILILKVSRFVLLIDRVFFCLFGGLVVVL